MQRPSPNFRSAEYFVYEIFKRFTQIYRNLFGDTMLVMPIQMSSNMADGNPRGEGHLGIFGVWYVPPGTPNWHPILKKFP